MSTSREKAGGDDGLPMPAAAVSAPSSSGHRRTRVVFGILAVLMVILLRPHGQLSLNALHKHMRLGSSKSNDKLNVILMISDGYGPASETFSRSFHQALHHDTSPTAHYKTPLDRIIVGSHRSRSTDSLITDSAAGATAFSCGLKSYNGAIGVDDRGKLCGTIFEGAKENGWLTGVVVTSRLSDATPASFFAHVPSRAQEEDIANEALGLTPNGTAYRDAPLDLAIGGGGCYFLPQTSPYSCRRDEQDLVGVSIKKGWHTKILFRQGGDRVEAVRAGENFHAKRHSTAQAAEANATAVQQFMADKSESLPLLALLAPFNTPYEVDRTKAIPPLHALAHKALDTLDGSPTNKKGFLLMIEGSQIDLCAHFNDPACHVREIEAYQCAIEKVTAWVDKKNKQGERTILISTSDHETGGVTLGRQLTSWYPNYAYYPERLIAVKQSTGMLSAQLLAYVRAGPKRSKEEVKRFVVEQTLGEQGAAFLPSNGGAPTEAEVQAVLACIPQTPEPPSLTPPPINTADVCQAVLADLLSRRVEMGWSTHGHTGVDVPVHAAGPNIGELYGNIENTDIGAFIAKQLRLDLADLTKRLRKKHWS